MYKTIHFVLSVAFVGMCVLPVSAQDAPVADGQSTTRQQSPRVTGLGQMDDVTTGDSIRVSELIGANVYDMNGEDIGDINDLVVDGTGQIRYVAVSYGGFLGINDELFAVPFKAFKTKRDSGGDHYLTLDITEERLKGARGFDQDNWPDFADQNFIQNLDRVYRVPATTNR